jgi:hypothetical protein
LLAAQVKASWELRAYHRALRTVGATESALRTVGGVSADLVAPVPDGVDFAHSLAQPSQEWDSRWIFRRSVVAILYIGTVWHCFQRDRKSALSGSSSVRRRSRSALLRISLAGPSFLPGSLPW